ncbi:uncharacterized protein EV154DRAFT_485652 [Mucor mucedo]|uniref:uncharacterized protein n=1 Tax=Mucor mucedo TaxID=29922 RepID=UPI00221F1B8F|nr:uncharacterized protein EV154DRAFT_485652 [Mucor mucedo]KAI7882084.1 hypothetical protein EV154DRAFT_485652 [Mucor mucedo]
MYSFTPEQIVSFVGHGTTITIKSNKVPVKGYLYTIDPDTKNVVLYDLDQQRVIIVMNHDIEKVSSTYSLDKIVDDKDKIDVKLMDSFFKYQADDEFTQEWIDHQRERVIGLFEKNRIPIHYDEPVIHVLGSARVESPYVATSVVCDNALIRKRVRDLLLQLSR